jgi:2-polyprenyl-3-methyl-5-hydroxy-6-metoxy-1,4-benzoquinol methylase
MKCCICGNECFISSGQVTLIRAALPEGIELKRRLNKCLNCGLIAVEPIPKDEILNKYYKEYAATVGRYPENKSKNGWSGRSILKSIQYVAEKVGKGRVLDVGCGDGGLLDQLPSSFKKFGVDLSKEACEQAQRRGITVFCSSFLETSFPCNFDIIIALDILEHFAEPGSVIEYMAKLLTPGGYLVIQTGNATSFAARFLKEDWAYTAVFGHLCALTPLTVRMITSQLGIKEISLTTSWHMKPQWIEVIYRNILAYGFHSYRRLYGLFEPIAEKISFFQNLNYHYPPPAPSRDHFTYIGRKVMNIRN